MAAVTAVAAVALGLLAGVLVGVLLTLFLVLWELEHVGVTELRPVRDELGDDLRPVPPGDLRDAADMPARLPGVLVLRLDGPLYTANVRAANRRIRAALETADADVRTVVVDASTLGMVSLAVVDQFADLERDLAEGGATLVVAGLSPPASALARRSPRWRELAAAGRVPPTALAAVRALRRG